MGSLCCFCPLKGRAKISVRHCEEEEEEQSVDSEPYSPKFMDFPGRVVETKRLGKIAEEGESPECPPCTPIVERGDDTYRVDRAATASISREEMKFVVSVPREYKGFVEKSPQWKSSRLTGHHNGGCVSPADSEKTFHTSLAMSPIDREHNCFSPIKSSNLHDLNTSFRWGDHKEEPSRMDKNVESGTAILSVQKYGSSAIYHGQRKLCISGHSGMQLNDISEVLGWYLHVSRTGQCILNHHQLRPIMDELKNWSMQVPGTVSLRYKHVSGMDVLLPWPDLRTGSKHETEKFAETVNRIEGRAVFYYLFMEHPQSFVKHMPPCVAPPAPTSVTKPTYSEEYATMPVHRYARREPTA